MRVKIDTKEKFTVITPEEPELNANLAEDLQNTLHNCLEGPVPNLVLNLKQVQRLDDAAAGLLARLQQQFYEQSASFVICEMQPAVEEKLEQLELLETMNVTPTETEAWDIVQMEEIERELLDSDDFEFENNND